MLANSIFDRVKKRLNGETGSVEKPSDHESDTQVIPDFGTSILFGGNSLLDAPVATTEKPVLHDAVHAIRLPQLALDESDFFQPTQVIEPTAPAFDDETQLVDFGSTQVIPRDTQADVPSYNFIEDDVIGLTQVLPTQSEILAAELTHTSLTDEENDLNDEADTTRDSSVQKNITTKTELQRIEQGLSAQKRAKNIQPGFESRRTDPMKKLFDAFDSDSDNEPVNSELGPALTPSTSPARNSVAPKEDSGFSSDSDADLVDVMDLLVDEPKKTPKKKKLTPIEEYAERLKRQLNSSPTNPNREILLDDSDKEDDFEVADEPEVPKLTKEQAFLIKQKFSRKQFKGNAAVNSKFHQHAKNRGNALFNELRRANAKQIQDIQRNNPDAELMEEIEREEEEMGNLLEREMERVRRIRKREKLHEKAQKALLEEHDADYVGDLPASGADLSDAEVPDSEVGSDESATEDSDASDAEDVSLESRPARARRVVLSDDEDEDEERETATNTHESEGRSDDSYMFGSTETAAKNDDPVMQIHSDGPRPESPVNSAIEQEIGSLQSDLHQLFSNLPPPRATQETSINEGELLNTNVHSFQETMTQKSDDTTFLATQVDEPDMDLKGTSTQDDNFGFAHQDAYSDEDDDLPAALANGRRRIQKNKPSLQNIEEANDAEENQEEENEEELKQKLALYEAKIRKKELKARKMRKEMERRGVKGIVEGEAEESDDEWKGVGGMDREDSDQANSEDERMIDNNFNIDLNDEEVRKKFMEQYQIKDRAELEKLIDDIKNHRLTKRSRANRFDIELSDEEDEILMAYRRQKLEEQKQRLLENQRSMQGSKSDKAQAFFDCIQEEPNVVVLLDSESENGDSCEEVEKSEFETKPKKRVLEESYVQRQLSFLSKPDEEDYLAIQRASNIQHGYSDDVEEISVLKQKCLSNLYSRPESSESASSLSEKRHIEEVVTDDDEDAFSRVFKKPSMVSSFRAHRDKSVGQVSSSFSGVTVNTHYKVASSSKASISYMSKQGRKQEAAPVFKSERTRVIEERVDLVKKEAGVYSSRDRFS